MINVLEISYFCIAKNALKIKSIFCHAHHDLALFKKSFDNFKNI
jgi:hypothetical protein